MKRYCVFFLLFCFFPLYGHEYHFRILPADYNADVQQIHLLFQSSDRLIWLGTDLGLFSYDGRKYKYFPRQDHLHQKVTAIAESPEGQTWAGYDDGQILISHFQGTLKNLAPDSIRGFSISKIVFLADDDVIIATYGKGLWLLHEGQFQHIVFGSLANITDIYDAVLDTKGQLWLGTDEGIWIYTAKPFPSLEHKGREQGLQDDIITHLSLNQQGNVLIGIYDYGVEQFNKVRNEVQEIKRFTPEDGSIIGLVSGFTNDIFMATEKALWFSSLSVQEHKITIPIPLKNRIECILFDRSGNLWLASGNRLYITSTQLEYVNPELTGIQAILSTPEQLWYGCQNGLFSTDKEGHHWKAYFTQQHINVLSLYKDTNDILWIGTFGQGLYIFNPVTQQIKHLTERDHLSNTSILNMDGYGKKVWLATLGGIIQIEWNTSPFDSGLNVAELHDQDESPPGYVYDVFVSSQGRVWFGTDGKGLFYLDKGQLLPFPISYQEGDSSWVRVRTVYSLTEDWEHRLWMSIAKGIVLCVDKNGKVVHKVTSPNGSLNSVALTGTEEVLMIREGAIQTLNPNSQIYWFDESSGLTQFTPSLNATSIDHDGSVWIADTDIILHYSSYNTFNDRYVRMHFEDISPGSLDQAQPIKLVPDSNFLDVRFTGIWYQDPSHVRYRYRLQGHDPDWIYTQEGRAVYSRLSPGAYTFIVQGSHDDDFTQSPTLQRSIVVLPPFYLNWWFILGILAGIGWIVYRFIRARIFRIQKFHRLEKEKTTLQLHAIQAQVNPHFLFNSFNTLSSIIEEDQQAAVAYVDQLSSFFRGALMHRDDELITLAEEMEIVRNYMYILIKRYGDNIHMEEHITNLAGWIAPLSIQLLVENAIKHNTVSAEKNLTIQITIDQHWVQVSNPIQPKFQSNEESTGFGLSSLLTRYTYLTPLKIEIKKETNRFTVKIPILYSGKGA
jgi:ligand-binding sensor domain-containing protein